MSQSGVFWSDLAISRIFDCESDKLKDIIEYLGFSPETFLRRAIFRGVDIRNQDLSEINTEFANFEGAIADETTLLADGKIPITDLAFTRDFLVSSVYKFNFSAKDFQIRRVRNTIVQKERNIFILSDAWFEMGAVFGRETPSEGRPRLLQAGRFSTSGISLLIKISRSENKVWSRIFSEISLLLPSAAQEMIFLDSDRKRLMDGDDINWRDVDNLIKFLNRRSNLSNVVVWMVSSYDRTKWDGGKISVSHTDGLQFIYDMDKKSRAGYPYGDLEASKVIVFDEVADALSSLEYASDGLLIFSDAAKKSASVRYRTWSKIRMKIVDWVLAALATQNSTPVTVEPVHME